MLPRLATVLAGIWLVLSPAVLGYGDPARANDRIVGPIIAGVAFVAIWEVVRALRWAALPLAAWLVAAPWVLGYDATAAVVSSVAAGIATLATTPPGAGDPSRFGGGWAALWRHPPPRSGGG